MNGKSLINRLWSSNVGYSTVGANKFIIIKILPAVGTVVITESWYLRAYIIMS